METTVKVKLKQGELTDYLQKEKAAYCFIYRRIYKIMVSDDFRERFKSNGELRKWATKEFKVPARIINTIIYDLMGLIKRTRENKKFLVKKMSREMLTLNRKIKQVQSQVERLKEKARNNKITGRELKRLRNKKKQLISYKKKKNRKKQLIENIQRQLKEEKPFRICLGSGRLFKKQFHLKENGYRSHRQWYEDFIYHRDHSISFMGARDEKFCNQLSSLIYNPENGTFTLRLRKFDSSLRGKDRYFWLKNLRIPYLNDQIREIVTGKNPKPLYHRYVFSKKGCYLHLSFKMDCPELKTEGYFGQCGLDLNDNFIELAASDLKGNLIYQEHIDLLFHGTGNRAKTEMEQKINHIVDLCVENNWELLGENLDFIRTLAKAIKASSVYGKCYNRMIHLFDYSRYKECLKRTAEKKGIKLSLINPAYTSINGLKRFGEEKKLNRHQAAAYYISRNSFEQR